MFWKEFLRPTVSKVIIFIILLGFIYFYEYSGPLTTDTSSTMKGFPLPFYIKSVCGDPCLSADDYAAGITEKITENFYYQNLVFDIIILYLVSISLVFIYHKIRK